MSSTVVQARVCRPPGLPPERKKSVSRSFLNNEAFLVFQHAGCLRGSVTTRIPLGGAKRHGLPYLFFVMFCWRILTRTNSVQYQKDRTCVEFPSGSKWGTVECRVNARLIQVRVTDKPPFNDSCACMVPRSCHVLPPTTHALCNARRTQTNHMCAI